MYSDLKLKTSPTQGMFNFIRQIQMTDDLRKNGTVRRAGVNLMVMNDKEKCFEELQTRILQTITYLNRIEPEQINLTVEK